MSILRASVPLLLLLAAAAAPAGAEGGPPPAPVRVETLKIRRIQDRRKVTGDLRAARRSLVAAQESAALLELPVREGEVVERGAVLARLDDERLRLEAASVEAQKRAALATVEVRRTELEKAERDRDTLEELAARGATNPRERADAASAFETARARVEEAEAEAGTLDARLALLRVRLADTVVKAPFRGMVVRRAAEVGQWLSEGDPVAELVSVDDLEAWLEVPQPHLRDLERIDTAIEVRIDATGETHERKERRIVREVDPRARTFRAIVPLSSAAGLAPGMSVVAWVPVGGAADHLVVSRAAILRNEAGPYLYAAEGGAEGGPAVARLVPVEVLFGVGDGAAVRGGGLAEGTRVVVEGNERLFPGAPLIPSEAGGAGTGGAGGGGASPKGAER